MQPSMFERVHMYVHMHLNSKPLVHEITLLMNSPPPPAPGTGVLHPFFPLHTVLSIIDTSLPISPPLAGIVPPSGSGGPRDVVKLTPPGVYFIVLVFMLRCLKSSFQKNKTKNSSRREQERERLSPVQETGGIIRRRHETTRLFVHVCELGRPVHNLHHLTPGTGPLLVRTMMNRR